jgi:Ohr subfamily peroxiredoxin
MSRSVKVLHTARTRTTGGRDQGVSRSDDGVLDIRLSAPGAGRIGANPEQLFAAAWSASLEDAIAFAARRRKIAAPTDLVIEAAVDLCLADGSDVLRARLSISLPGVDLKLAQALVDEASQTCAYSKATRGNIDVVFDLVRS